MPATNPYTVQLAPEVHAYIQPDGGWCLNNTGFVSDGASTLLVDTTATTPTATASSSPKPRSSGTPPAAPKSSPPGSSCT